jgi:anti-sigma regulatory factor (Ser/Thr protein kinase)
MAPRALLSLAASPTSPSLARGWLTERLDRVGIDGLHLTAALLVVSELVANAVVHGQQPIVLNVTILADAIRIEVSDAAFGVTPLASHVAANGVTSGRGLFIVNAVADRWGETPNEDQGKTVWAEIGLTAA